MLDYYDLIYILHFLVVGPLLIYVGYYKERTPPQLMNLVLALGAIVTIYHAYEFGRSVYFKSQMKVKVV